MRFEMAEDDRDTQQSRPPTISVKVVIDVLAMVVGKLVFELERQRQRSPAPSTGLRVSARLIEETLKSLGAHVVAAGEVVIRKTPSGEQIPARPNSSAPYSSAKTVESSSVQVRGRALHEATVIADEGLGELVVVTHKPVLSVFRVVEK